MSDLPVQRIDSEPIRLKLLHESSIHVTMGNPVRDALMEAQVAVRFGLDAVSMGLLDVAGPPLAERFRALADKIDGHAAQLERWKES